MFLHLRRWNSTESSRNTSVSRVLRIQSASVSMRKKPCFSSDQCQLHVLEYWPHGSTKVRLQPAQPVGVRMTENVMWHVRVFRSTSVVMRLRNHQTYNTKLVPWNFKNMLDKMVAVKYTNLRYRGYKIDRIEINNSKILIQRFWNKIFIINATQNVEKFWWKILKQLNSKFWIPFDFEK